MASPGARAEDPPGPLDGSPVDFSAKPDGRESSAGSEGGSSGAGSQSGAEGESVADDGVEPLDQATANDSSEAAKTGERLEPRTPVRNRPVSVGMSPKSPAPEAGVTQIARDIESQVDKMEETLAAYETDLTKRLDQIVSRLKD